MLVCTACMCWVWEEIGLFWGWVDVLKNTSDGKVSYSKMISLKNDSSIT